MFSYFYFIVRADRFINIFRTWSKLSLHYPIKDGQLQRDITIIPLIVFTSAAFETTWKHLEYFAVFDIDSSGQFVMHNDTLGKSTLHIYYGRAYGNWEKYIGYHPALALLAFVSHKFILACWNYVDVLMIIFARCLYFKFKILCKVAEDNLNHSGAFWTQKVITSVGKSFGT